MSTKYTATFTDRQIKRTSDRTYTFAYLVQIGSFTATGFAASKELALKAARAHNRCSVYPKKMVRGYVVQKTRAEMQAERDEFAAKSKIDRLEVVEVEIVTTPQA